MSTFNLERSFERAAEILDEAPSRKSRSDRGRSRLDPAVLNLLEGLLKTQERLPVRQVMGALREKCADMGMKPPARATIYEFMAKLDPGEYEIADLPEAARETLYNLPAEGKVPAHQLAFYCFSYGDGAAVSFAAGLPWLALFQAERMRGWRPRSKGLLQAVLKARRIAR